MNYFGKKIQELRKKAGLGQIEFARRAGVGLRFVRELEQGKTTVRLDKVNQVLEFLGHHLEVVRNGKGQ
jgi:y4mF family transcriptional regulator